ncbi:MAG: SMI1/KNR4 family protein [Planctomycetia bacterium]|nr:SMI1/KNR4 family protein [Planctomycetia bacterium]
MDDYYNEMNALMSQVKPLVSNCEYQTMWVLPALNTDELTEEEKAFYLQLPQTVKTWLSLTNGWCGSRQDIYGLQDIIRVSDEYPNWFKKGWIPIADGGCFNYFVIVPQKDKPEYQWPVVYIDANIEDLTGDTGITCIVSSSATVFYREELKLNIRDIESYNEGMDVDHLYNDSPWWYDINKLMAIDPMITTYNLPLPW